MANVLTARPLVLDTVMVSDFLTAISAVAGVGRPLRVKKIVWQSPGASSTLTITDGSTAANVLIADATPASFVGSNLCYDFTSPVVWKNFKLTALTAGKVEIWTE